MILAVSSCLAGELCNYQGVANSLATVIELLKLAEKMQIKIVRFCPEQSTMGTPREAMNIFGGDGVDVLQGSAVVKTHSGNDVTSVMLMGAENMLELCKTQQVTDALLMEGSPSCATHWVFKGESWPEKKVTHGLGVTAALLLKNGIKVHSSADLTELFERVNRV